MKKNKTLFEIFVIVIFILLEILILKLFYSKGELLNYRSNFWIVRELLVLIFLGIFHIIIKREIEYFDVFIVLFPVLGYVLLLLEKVLFFWSISTTMIEKILYVEEEDKEDKNDYFSKDYLDVMSYNELLLSDNPEKKKRFLYYYNPEEICIKTEVLKKALLDENIDVIHYAATELNKIDTDIQSEINKEEKKENKNEIKIYYLYKKYVDSGLLIGAIRDFYINKLFNILNNLKISEAEKKYEFIYLYRKTNQNEKYEKLVKEILDSSTEKLENKEILIISEYLKFLHKENRFRDLLKEYKKYSKINKNVERPNFLNEHI